MSLMKNNARLPDSQKLEPYDKQAKEINDEDDPPCTLYWLGPTAQCVKGAE